MEVAYLIGNLHFICTYCLNAHSQTFCAKYPSKYLQMAFQLYIFALVYHEKYVFNEP